MKIMVRGARQTGSSPSMLDALEAVVQECDIPGMQEALKAEGFQENPNGTQIGRIEMDAATILYTTDITGAQVVVLMGPMTNG
jgi:hypothetical protein